jgi:predicted membrane-bound spermidine synthase
MGWFFVFFFVSGFCSLLYELVWLRLAVAHFGVTTALTSIVLSMFMAGLGLGSWGAGVLLRRYAERIRLPVLRLYAMAELLIGVSAIAVRYELLLGRHLLRLTSLSASWAYYVVAGILVALTIVPWCACMGATIPLAMQAIRRHFPDASSRSFSFLYLANVLGAVAGTTLPLLVIEQYGFFATLEVGASLNAMLALSAALLATRFSEAQAIAPVRSNKSKSKTSGGGKRADALSEAASRRSILMLLFLTGITSLGIEVIWIRQFTPYVGTVVYAFALILGTYLASTFLGSQLYRLLGEKNFNQSRSMWAVLGLTALLPLITADPQLHLPTWLRLAVGIAPFSGLLGFITPMLVDRWSRGDPDRAGTAYAVNVVGCILGPLFCGFLILPLLNERWAMGLLIAPWLVVSLRPELWPEAKAARAQPRNAMVSYGIAALSLILVIFARGYENQFPRYEVLHDNTATVIATGEGMNRRLLVNGVGMTMLTPITKMMAHIPLTLLDRKPQNALDICFGMGTTFRSMLSWNIATTAVELVPSVPKLFGYYHADAAHLLQSPLAHVVVDDGRRYLERTTGQYDVIAIDPPPPVQAAGSSLLYSKQFYEALKPRLRQSFLRFLGAIKICGVE